MFPCIIVTQEHMFSSGVVYMYCLQTARRSTGERITWILLFVVCWSIGIGLLTHSLSVTANADTRYVQYRVVSGETLWTIARSISTTGDTQSTIQVIEQLNHLQSDAIIPGQTILVPQP